MNLNKTYLNLRMLSILLLGFSSGLPIALVTGTLQAWFKTAGASIVTIGFMSLVTQPYSYKFLWAPVFDKYWPKFLRLDRRRSWILLLQIIIILLIMNMAWSSPEKTLTIRLFDVTFVNLPILCIFGFILAFCSASQDIVIEAHRTEVLAEKERGFGAALGVEGYRGGMLISSGVALILADNIGWHKTYLIMAACMLLGVLGALVAPKADTKNIEQELQVSLWQLLKNMFIDFLQRDRAWLILLLIVLYKLGDAFSHALSTPFLLDLNFTLTEIGFIVKIVALIATLLGVFFGGIIIPWLGLFRALLIFGILQAATNLTYMVLAIIGKQYYVACGAFFIESLCGGMGTAAFVAFLMGLCSKQFTASQFALLTSLAAIGRIYVGPVSGFLVKAYGWVNFYALTVVFALPGLILLLYLRETIIAKNKRELLAQPVV